MLYRLEYEETVHDWLDCLGEFNSEDEICKKHCGLRLRCAIESNRHEQLEILEDIYDPEDLPFRSH